MPLVLDPESTDPHRPAGMIEALDHFPTAHDIVLAASALEADVLDFEIALSGGGDDGGDGDDDDDDEAEAEAEPAVVLSPARQVASPRAGPPTGGH